MIFVPADLLFINVNQNQIKSTICSGKKKKLKR